jgi:acetyltransferase-like isoleucine patch superfamily enzyme
MKKIIFKLFPIYQFIYHLLSSARIGLRLAILKLKLNSLGAHTKIYSIDMTEPFNVSIGHHVYINKNCDILTTGSKVTIGNYVMIGPNVTFIAQNHDISDWRKPMVFNDKYEFGDIKVCDDVWIGANATILPGVSIGKGSIVAAGAVVTKDVEPYTVVAGVPAKTIKKRLPEKDIEKAQKIDFRKFEKKDLDWKAWTGKPAFRVTL